MEAHRWTLGLQGPASSLRTYLTPVALVFGNCCQMHDEGPRGFPGEVICPYKDPPTTEHSRLKMPLSPPGPLLLICQAWTCLPGLCVTPHPHLCS